MPSKDVFASIGPKICKNDHLQCAEMRLVDLLMRDARKHGVPPWSSSEWIRRKFGKDVLIWRPLANGSLGCCVPCCLCRNMLQKMDFDIHVVTSDNETWFHGPVDLAPPSKMTSIQRHVFHHAKNL